MRKGGEVQFAFNQKCACGPFLNPDEVRVLPDTISGYLNGPPHQNCIRKSLHAIVNAAVDPNQLLELFSSEFYQSKKHKDIKLDNTICLEITGKNGKRFLRRVRGPSRSGILGKYLHRICEMLQCCPYLIVEDRYPSGRCQTNCHSQCKYVSFKQSFQDDRYILKFFNLNEALLGYFDPLCTNVTHSVLFQYLLQNNRTH